MNSSYLLFIITTAMINVLISMFIILVLSLSFSCTFVLSSAYESKSAGKGLLDLSSRLFSFFLVGTSSNGLPPPRVRQRGLSDFF